MIPKDFITWQGGIPERGIAPRRPRHESGDIAAFLKEERAVRAALRPTIWLADVPANIEMPNESKIVSVIVEVVANEADAPAFASEQARRFVRSEIRGNSQSSDRNSLCCAGSETRPKSRRALARAAFLSGLDRRIQALTYGDIIFANRPALPVV